MRHGFGYQYIFDEEIKSGETVYVKMPPLSADKRGVNDIGWQTNGNIALYASLSREADTALWTEIVDRCDINKTISLLKIVNPGAKCRVTVKVILC